MSEYHIRHDEPCLPHWPKGSWSLYRITGEEIASRTVWERVNPKGWYEGEVIYRHAWCGYLGMWETLPELVEAIKADIQSGATLTHIKMGKRKRAALKALNEALK